MLRTSSSQDKEAEKKHEKMSIVELIKSADKRERKFKKFDVYYKMLKNRIQIKKSDVIVDAGCAVGYIDNMLWKRGHKKIKAFDISPKLIIAANIRFKEKINFFVSDMENISLRDETADLIIVFNSLHHLPKHDECSKEFHRILKPKGGIFVVEPNLFHPYAVFTHLKSNTTKNEFPVNPFKLKKVFGRYFDTKLSFIRYGVKILLTGVKK